MATENPRFGVVIGTPSRNGYAPLEYTTSMIETQRALWQNGHACGMLAEMNESILPAGRNRIVAKFLSLDRAWTHLLWIDDDMQWSGADVIRLLSHGEDFVAGGYLRKDNIPSPRWTCKLEENPVIDGRGLTRAFGVGMGFTMISRAALERMYAAYQDRPYEDLSLPDLPMLWLFDIEVRDARVNGEDYIFCELWLKIGGEIWVDTTLELGHIGRKTWKANLAAGIEKSKVDRERPVAAAAE